MENQSFNTYQKFIIAILALIQFTIVLDFMVISPLGDILMKSLELSPSQFGWTVSSYAFSAGISGILAAGFADKFDRKKLLLFFYVGFILGTLFCGLANTFYMLLAARIVTGLFGGVISAISMAIVTDLFAINQRGKVMGYTQMAFAVSQVIGIPLSLYIANLWNWHAAFLMIVAVATCIGLAIVIKMKSIDEHLKLQSDKNAFQHLTHSLSNKRYQSGFLMATLLPIGGFMLMPFGSAFLVNNVNVSQTNLPLVFLFTGISSFIIMPIIGRLSDKVNKFYLFTTGSLLAIVMVIIYTHMSTTPIWAIIIINMILFMGIMSRMIPATIISSAIPEMKDRGAYMSITSSLQQLAGGIAAICAGLIVTQKSKSAPLENYPTLGYVVSVVIIICIYFFYKVNKLVNEKKM